jgi:SOS-response transcriptional repressor LexA
MHARPSRHPLWSPAQDYFDGRIDLNAHLIKDVTSTFIVCVIGDSIERAGISVGDELIVNRSPERAALWSSPSWTAN